MHLHQQAIRASRHTRQRHRRHQITLAHTMRRIAQNRQMRQLLQHRNRGHIICIPRVRLKRPYATLAQHQVVVPARQNIFGAQQHLFNRRRNPSLQQHRLAHMPQLAQQIKVLHIPRTDLEAIDIRQHQLNLRDLHHLGNHQQPKLIGHLAQQLQPFQPHALEAIRRAARLERAAPQELRTSSGHLLRTQPNLLAALHRARPGHDNHFIAANDQPIRKRDPRSLRSKPAPRQLVRRRDPIRLLHTRKHLELRHLKVRRRSHPRKNSLRLTRCPVDIKSQLHHPLNHMLYLFIGG